MPVKIFIVGKETSFQVLLKKLWDTYAIETVFVQKTQEVMPGDALVFLESAQAEKWLELDHRLPPSLLLPESFPPPIPLKKLANANMRLMPRETDGHVLAKLLLLDIELHRFSKSISDLNAENQELMSSIFEEFRHTFNNVRLQIHELLLSPKSKETLLKLRTIVHRLAGSSGSYGFISLSKAAKALEDAIENENIQNLADEFLEMLSLLLPPKIHEPPFLKTLLIYDPGQQARNQHLHWFQSLSINTVWGMDWVECWKMAQTYPLSEAILNMDNLPVESWPPLFEALNNSPAFAALPKRLVKQNMNDAEKACAVRLNCLASGTPPATFEELAEMLLNKKAEPTFGSALK